MLMQEGAKKNTLRVWLAIVGTATLVLGASYSMVQQSARLAADEAPLTVAQDAKQKISDDISPAEIVPEEETDLGTDSGVFLIITDPAKKVLATSAVLDDKAPLPPSAVFSDAERNGSDRFTWEPKNGVRLATQVLRFNDNNGGYIIAGQSLSETEKRLKTYNLIALLAWLAVIVWTMILLFPAAGNMVPRRRKKT